MSQTSGNDLQEHRDKGNKAYGILSSPELYEFWQLESIGIREQTDNTDDDMAMKIFKEILIFEKG